MEFGGWELPAGVHIAPSIYLLHRRPDLYPDPHAFRPERFLGDDPPGTYEWIPFGGGVRRCLGASFALFEMQIVLRTVLALVRLERRPGRGRRASRGGRSRSRRRAARGSSPRTPSEAARGGYSLRAVIRNSETTSAWCASGWTT